MRTQIIPVVHYADEAQAMRNAERAFAARCEGVLLIHMDGENQLLPPVARAIKERWPDRLVGINLLGQSPEEALAVSLAAGLDMTWTDAQPTHSASSPYDRADRLAEALASTHGHLLFVGVAFKHQRPEPHPGEAARLAVARGFIPTTSGPATGIAAEVDKIAEMRTAIGESAPLAIASGITPGNARDFAPHLSHILVATGVSSDFHEFDPGALADLRAACL